MPRGKNLAVAGLNPDFLKPDGSVLACIYIGHSRSVVSGSPLVKNTEEICTMVLSIVGHSLGYLSVSFPYHETLIVSIKTFSD